LAGKWLPSSMVLGCNESDHRQPGTVLSDAPSLMLFPPAPLLGTSSDLCLARIRSAEIMPLSARMSTFQADDVTASSWLRHGADAGTRWLALGNGVESWQVNLMPEFFVLLLFLLVPRCCLCQPQPISTSPLSPNPPGPEPR
jgi:hypothetical protein